MADDTFAPDVRGLINDLSASLAQHQDLLTALDSATAAQATNRDALSNARNALLEAQRAYAQSNSEPATESLAELVPVVKALGDQPFYDLKVRLAREAVDNSWQAIQEQKVVLKAAFDSFGQGLWPQKMAAFEAAAQTLRSACLDLVAVRAGFAVNSSHGVPELVIGKLPSQSISGNTFINSRWITLDKISGDLWTSIMSLNHDVDQALRSQVG